MSSNSQLKTLLQLSLMLFSGLLLHLPSVQASNLCEGLFAESGSPTRNDDTVFWDDVRLRTNRQASKVGWGEKFYRLIKKEVSLKSIVSRRLGDSVFLSLDDLPNWHGREAQDLLIAPDTFQYWYGLHRARYSMSNADHPARAEAFQKSVEHIGRVRLTEVLLDSGTESDHGDWAFSPAVLGYLQSGQPVVVYLLSAFDSRVASNVKLPIIRHEQQDFIRKAVASSWLRLNTRFYGIQDLGNGVQGLILSLPPAGLPLQFGGDKYFTPGTFSILQRVLNTMRVQGLTAQHDLRPYISRDGMPFLMPTTLGEISTESANRIGPGNRLEETLSRMGISVTEKDKMSANVDANSFGAENALWSELELLVSKGYESSLPQIVKTLNKNDLLSIVHSRLRIALAQPETIDLETRRHVDLTVKTASLLFEALGTREELGPKLPFVAGGKFVASMYLRVGSHCAIQPRSRYWKRTDILPLGSPAVVRVEGFKNITGEQEINLRILNINGELVDKGVAIRIRDWQDLDAYMISEEDTFAVARSFKATTDRHD